jgi:tRNA threonylcarbamoyladenosine biosynthesis protein TsaB
MVLANRLALVGVHTLDVTAAGQQVQDLPLVVGLHAGRGRLAVAWYGANLASGTWRLLKPAEIIDIHILGNQIKQPTLVCGEFTEEEQRLLRRKRRNVILASPAHSLRRPAVLAELAWKRWQLGDVDDPVELSPIYLHIGAAIPG